MKFFHAIITATVISTSFISTTPAKAADAFWLDQYNALFYIGTFQLDNELREMKDRGSKTLLLHADSLPSIVSRFIAWRAKKAANMETVAWIQRPNENNLRHAARLVGIKAVQIDDHYFNDPPVSIKYLRSMLGKKQLWCSFQPRQFSNAIASTCDQNDVQIYRHNCKETGDIAWKMGITGNPKIAVAAYEDGSKKGEENINCIRKDLKTLGTDLFVFKWKNQEIWTKKILNLPKKP